MPSNKIFAILEMLLHAYPEKQLSKASLNLYADELADIPVLLLERSVSQHIRTSTFFPHISELRQAAQQLAGTSFFNSGSCSGVDSLALQAQQLENDYFHRGEFDLQHWDKLADQLENLDRPYRAAALRQKATHIQAMEAAFQRGEQYPPLADRLRYAEWENGLANQPD